MSFDVSEGDAVGVIGSNGSGKSTLLAALAGLLSPTSGEILVAEEPKLLGVGATLLPAATGYRNIRLGCLALGMSRREVDERIDEIVAFTELGEAIDRPLRTYSSGMRARLHFAIATSVQAADPADRRGAGRRRPGVPRQVAARIDELLAHAGTLMLVSHSLDEIRKQCNRALWIEQGILKADGPVDECDRGVQRRRRLTVRCRRRRVPPPGRRRSRRVPSDTATTPYTRGTAVVAVPLTMTLRTHTRPSSMTTGVIGPNDTVEPLASSRVNSAARSGSASMALWATDGDDTT